jgi:hypothetical protein
LGFKKLRKLKENTAKYKIGRAKKIKSAKIESFYQKSAITKKKHGKIH